MKDEKIIKVYNDGKKKFYINNLVAGLILPITTTLFVILVNYINNIWLGWDLVLYSLLIGYLIITILYVTIVPIIWGDIKNKYNSIEKK